MVETKGEHLDNDESKKKAKIGDQRAKLAGKQYKYYMVFAAGLSGSVFYGVVYGNCARTISHVLPIKL